MKKATLTFVTLLFLAFSLQSQISGSVKLGLSGYQGDLHCRTDNNIKFLDDLNPSLGIGIRYPFSDVIGLRAEASYFQLSGDETQFSDGGHAARGWGFDNNFLEISALIDWEILGHKRFVEGGTFKRTLTPVIFGGFGLAFNSPDVNFKNSTNSNISDDEDNGGKAALTIPVGLGLKYYLSERFALGLETGLRLPISDYYDGVSESANPDNNDMYGFGGVKAYFTLGKKADQDGDGISDKKDACPTVPGLKLFNGCPDSDGDGIVDDNDACPNTFGLKAAGGCPDTDNDGILDKNDNCPEVAGLAATKGCPDADADGIADGSDKCPNAVGTAATDGCPDSDNDGIIDTEDKCPNKAGIAAKNGCPFVDSDNDGIEDAMDACPNEKGLKSAKGCPDGDGDGIADKNDKCPTIASSNADGCPTAPAVDTKVVTERLSFSSKNIQFKTSSSIIKNESYIHLNEVINILNSYPSVNISINGYTDSRGNAANNQKLSERRAKATYDFFASKGISPSRMSYTGYGEANPIASNDTSAGQKMNRRVEIIIQ